MPVADRRGTADGGSGLFFSKRRRQCIIIHYSVRIILRVIIQPLIPGSSSFFWPRPRISLPDCIRLIFSLFSPPPSSPLLSLSSLQLVGRKWCLLSLIDSLFSRVLRLTCTLYTHTYIPLLGPCPAPASSDSISSTRAAPRATPPSTSRRPVTTR